MIPRLLGVCLKPMRHPVRCIPAAQLYVCAIRCTARSLRVFGMAQSDSAASPYLIESEGTMPPQGENGAAGRKLVLVRASRGLWGLGARRATNPTSPHPGLARA